MRKALLFIIGLLFLSTVSLGQISLTGSSYVQNFDNIGAGLPSGFQVVTNASGTSLGTASAFTTSATSWNTTTAGWKNYASADGLTSSATTATQSSHPDRAIGVRQTGSVGDPGVALEMNLANTIGLTNFSLEFKLQSLDATSTRTTIWRVDYGFGASPTSFTAVATSPATITTSGAFGSTTVTANFGNALDNINQPIWIRIVSLTASTVSGNRATSGIDDLILSYTGATTCTPPATQASAASISNITANSFDIAWTAGSGTKSLVVVKAGSAVSGTPANGTAYTANTSFGSGGTIATGEYVVYNSIGTNVSVTGLTPGASYHIAVYSFDATGNCYLTSNAAIDNDVTLCAEPTVQVSTITITPATNTATINWSGGNGGSSLVLLNTTNSFTAPTDGTVYTGNTTYISGQQTIYSGTASTVNVSGLTTGTTYYATVYTFNNCSSNPDYLTTGNTVQSFTTNAGSSCTAGIPAGYYSTITTQTCAALKTELSNIITAGFVRENYGSLDDVHFLTTDDRLSDDGLRTIVWDMYSDNPAGADPYEFNFGQMVPGGFNNGSTSDGEGNGWNKEHSFPNSWFSASSSTGNDPGSDLHHIYPTDMDVNALRSNYPFGKVQTATTTTANGSKLGSSALTFGSYTGPVFEPIDAYKGDFARATLYMVTRYQSQQPSWETLQTGGDVVMDGTTYPSIEIDYLQMLLSWHNLDPVSQKEIDRNNTVYCYQFNRNPFIDHPEYVSQIWSSACGLALPIDLTVFTAQLTNRGVLLNWKVENAQGFSHFALERSINGGTYQAIGTINWINGQSNYSFTDPAANLSGKILYRLKMVDANNIFKYSKIAAVELSATTTIFPNPATDKVTLFFKNKTVSTAKATIIDMYGRSVSTVVVPAGVHSYNIGVSSLAPARYSVRIEDGTEVTSLPFIIVR